MMKLQRILLHMSIVFCSMMLVLVIIDRINSAMGFLTCIEFSILTILTAITVITSSIMVLVRVNRARRKHLSRINSNEKNG